MIKLGGTVLVSVGLAGMLAMAYIGEGLGGGITPVFQIMMSVAALAILAGLYAVYARNKRLLIVSWGYIGVVLAGMLVQDQIQRREIVKVNIPINQQENDLLLANAVAKVPCDNGDVATLQMFHREANDYNSLSIQIVPADRGEKSSLIVSASGQFLPPSNRWIDEYRARTHTDCKSADYPSLDAMMDKLKAHHAAEQHKYEKPPRPAAP